MRVDLVVVCVAAVALSLPALLTCDPLYVMLAPNLQTVSSAPSFSPSASNASQSEHVRKTTISGVHPVESMIKVTGYVGKSAEIRCPYDRSYVGYSKYLCRGRCIWGIKDIPIRTEAGQTKAVNGRFSLHDDTTAGVFTVTITGLTPEDSGQYWCGVTTGFGRYDVFTEVKLNVKKEACSTLKTGKIDKEERSNRICHKDTNYVYQVTVEKMSLTHHMRIDQVIREGADKVHEGARREFAGYPTCRDKLALEVGKTYLVIGRREDYKGRNKYLLSTNTWVEVLTPEYQDAYDDIMILTNDIITFGCKQM